MEIVSIYLFHPKNGKQLARRVHLVTDYFGLEEFR